MHFEVYILCLNYKIYPRRGKTKVYKKSKTKVYNKKYKSCGINNKQGRVQVKNT